jgi:hypothetical protein
MSRREVGNQKIPIAFVTIFCYNFITTLYPKGSSLSAVVNMHALWAGDSVVLVQ